MCAYRTVEDAASPAARNAALASRRQGSLRLPMTERRFNDTLV
jgi:hypothetical protein